MSDDAPAVNLAAPAEPRVPLRVLMLRGVDGAGGGADKIILRNAQHVDSRRIQMSLVFLRHEQDAHFDLDRRAAANQLDYHEVRHRGPWDRRVYSKLLQLTRSLRPDILHAHEYKANYFARRLARELNVPVMSTAHGWTGDSWRERWLYYPADKRQLRHFDAVVAVSTQIAGELIQHGAAPQRVHVLLNGVDPDRYQRDPALRTQVRQSLGFQDNHCVLGAVGRAESQKRFDLLLQAFARLARERPELRLVIAGDGSLLAALRAQARELRVDDRVLILGHCPHMLEVYHAFDIFAQTSDYEGTPTVIVEAMALRIPIVATDVGGTCELVTHGQHALLVPPQNETEWCNAVRQTMDDPLATLQRISAARERVEQVLSFKRRLERLCDIYESLARGRVTSSSPFWR